MNKNVFDVLDNADDEMIEKLSSFTDDDAEVKKRILDMSERKFKEMTSEKQTEQLNESNETEIKIRKNASRRLSRVLSAAAAIAIVAGAGTAVYSHMANLKSSSVVPPAMVSPETTEQPAETEATDITETEQDNNPSEKDLSTVFNSYFDIYFVMAYIGSDDVMEQFDETEEASILQYVKDKDDSDQNDENEYVDIDGKLYEYKDYYLFDDPELQDYEKFKDFMAEYFTDPFNVYLDKTTIGTDIGDAEYIPENDYNIDKTVIGIGGKTYIRKSGESWPFAKCNMNDPVYEQYIRGKDGDLYGEKMYIIEDPETGNKILRSYILHLVITTSEPTTFKDCKYKIESALFGNTQLQNDTDLSALKYEDYSYIDNYLPQTEAEKVFENAERIEAENSGNTDLPLVPEISSDLTEAEAKAILEEHNYLTQTKVTYSDTIPEGYLIKTDPPAGTPYKEGKMVLIYASRGKMSAKVIFPDVYGKPADEVKKMLDDLDLTVKVVDRYSEDYPEGIVLDSNFSANDVIEIEKEEVILYVSSGNSEQQSQESDN